ncbi:EF-hand domain-containing protein [Streptomyces sp. NPDC087844]|uniref:EF-hand domain-containing protein n=1 Tax=Streptomyces sp. NPDC087844 TaxID=3365805 RepID=UPI0037F84390
MGAGTELRARVEALLAAGDPDGDGRISPEEHRHLVETWNGRSVNMAGVFESLDLSGDGYLGREEFALLWRQFWISDDPGEPGNLLCGRFAA